MDDICESSPLMRTRLPAYSRAAVLSVPVMLSLCLPRVSAFAPSAILSSARHRAGSVAVRGGMRLKPPTAPGSPRVAPGRLRMMSTDVADEVSTGPVDVQSYEAKSDFIKVMQAPPPSPAHSRPSTLRGRGAVPAVLTHRS